MLSKIFLTAQGFYNVQVLDHLAECFKGINNPIAVIITTAADDKANNLYNIKDRASLMEIGFTQVDFVDLEHEQNRNFDNYDLIYVCGGNTFRLMKYVRKSNFGPVISSHLARGGVYFGVSCGSLILAPKIDLANEFTSDNKSIGITDFSGLDLLPITIFPHYDKSLESRISEFEKEHSIEVTRLSDSQALIVDYASSEVLRIG